MPKSKIERLSDEKQFHEAQAAKRQSEINFKACLTQNDQAYARHASWIEPGLKSLGDVSGKQVLDWGCGHGMASVYLAHCGATVYSTDLAYTYCQEVKLRSGANFVDQNIKIFQGDACRLPLANDSLDAVWGNAILHHIDAEVASIELHRILKPGGKIVLCDPWRGSILTRLIRSSVPYPGKARTSDETPLDESYIQPFRYHFENVKISFWDLLGAAERFVPLGPFRYPLRRIDRFLLDSFNVLAQSSRYIMITAEKSIKPNEPSLQK